MQTLTAEKLYKAFEKMPQSEQTKFRKRIEAKPQSSDNDIVAYTLTGDSLTREQYIAQIDEAIDQCDRGEITTQEDFIKESETWL